MRICIAGAGAGLGFALSRLLAEKGHKVYAGCRNKNAPAVREAAEKISFFEPLELDVTNEKMVEAAARYIGENGGKLDAVVFNAGILPDGDKKLPLTESSIDDLHAVLEVHAVGTVLMIKHFNSLVKDGGMFIIITSEAGSMTNIGTMYPLYSISKAAQNKLTAIFAKTVSNYTVYAVHPGRMNTVMGRDNAQIEPEESAEGILRILTKEKIIPPEKGWFINYRGEPMEK